MNEAGLRAWLEAPTQEPLPEPVEDFLAHARQAWPRLSVPQADFLEFVAQRLRTDAGRACGLEGLMAGDLYLGCGCAMGNERAAEAFHRDVAPHIEAAARRIDVDHAHDVAQLVYRRLFLPGDGATKKIDGYLGRGDLRRWARVVATRVAIDEERGRKRGDPLDSASDRLVQGSRVPELKVLRETYRREFKEAFAAAVRTLDDRERNVLRYHLAGMTADQIGRMYGAHRVTVARWLGRVRRSLEAETRASLRAQLDVDTRDVDSIMRLVDLGRSVSLERLLASNAE